MTPALLSIWIFMYYRCHELLKLKFIFIYYCTNTTALPPSKSAWFSLYLVSLALQLRNRQVDFVVTFLRQPLHGRCATARQLTHPLRYIRRRHARTLRSQHTVDIQDGSPFFSGERALGPRRDVLVRWRSSLFCHCSSCPLHRNVEEQLLQLTSSFTILWWCGGRHPMRHDLPWRVTEMTWVKEFGSRFSLVLKGECNVCLKGNASLIWILFFISKWLRQKPQTWVGRN